MADIGEILGENNPEQYKKLLDLYHDLRQSQPYTDAANNAAQKSTDYGDIFSKQLAQDTVDQSSLPGKSAAQSAEVFKQHIPEGIEEGKSLIPVKNLPVPYEGAAEAAAGGTGEGVLSGLAKVASRLGIPATVLYEFLKSTPANAGEDKLVAKMRGEDNSASEEKPFDLEAYLRMHPGRIDSNEEEQGSNYQDLTGNDSQQEGEYTPTAQNVIDQTNKNGEAIPTSSGNGLAKPASTLAERPATNLLQAIYKSPASYNPESNDAFLRQAMDDRNQSNLLASLGKAANLAGASLASKAGGGIQTHNDVSNDIEKNAGNALQDVATQKALSLENSKINLNLEKLKSEQEGNKIDSPYSIAARQVAVNQFQNIGYNPEGLGSLTANQIAKILPNIKTQDVDNRMMKLLQMKLASQELTSKGKNNNKINDRFEKFGGDIDPNKARTGELGKNQGRLNAADRLQGLITQFPDGNIPATQMREVATAVASLVGGGSNLADHQVNEFVPHTGRGTFEDTLSWLTNEPRGRQQQAFVKLMADTANRERDIALTQKNQAIFQKAYVTHSELKNVDEDRFYTMLSRATKIPVDKLKEIESDPDFLGDYKPEYNQFVKGSKPIGKDTTNQQSGPKPGSIEEHDGKKYKFLGGDAANPKSWEMQ